jgi:hypothetical protein
MIVTIYRQGWALALAVVEVLASSPSTRPAQRSARRSSGLPPECPGRMGVERRREREGRS